MKGLSKIILAGIAGLIILLVLWGISVYNGLIRYREDLNTAWAQVETHYQRRFDLVPNLVSTVEGAAAFERETFTELAQARSQWQASPDRDERIAAAGQFESALARLLVTVEAYPQLQATQAFKDLMAQLEGTENRIAVARKDYNDEVRRYNIFVRTFPRSLLAGMFGYTAEKPFDSTPGAEQAPVVDFSS